ARSTAACVSFGRPVATFMESLGPAGGTGVTVPRLENQAFTVLRLARAVKNLCVRTEGASLVEYAMVLCLIALICMGAIQLLGQELSSFLSRVAAAMSGL